MTPQIKIRFANPIYNRATKKFKLDVEFQSDTDAQRIFGINVRFFYDATVFLPGTKANVRFIEFATGYALANQASIVTSATIGKPWFNLATNPVTYVNWAVQTNNANAAPLISKTGWTKLFAVEVTSKDILSGSVCPAFIWDKKNADAGYMPGNEGVTMISIVDATGEVKNQQVIELPVHYNWTHVKSTVPYGHPSNTNCVTL